MDNPHPWTTFPAPLVPGTKVIVRGIPNEKHRFTVDFLAEAGEHSQAKPIAFHFDVRMAYGGNRSYIAMNTRDEHEHWDADQVDSDVCPFETNVPFELVFQVDEKQFTVFIDGKQTHQFQHRMDYRTIKQVRVYRCVTLHGVEVVQ